MAPLLETYLPIGRGRFAVFVTSEYAVYEIVNYEVWCSGSKLFFFNYSNGTFNTGLRCPGSSFYICPNPFSVATNGGQTLQQIRFEVEPPQIIQLPGPIATSTYDSSRGSYGGYGGYGGYSGYGSYYRGY